MAEQHREIVQLCSVRAGAGLYGVDTRAIREVLGNAAPQPVPLAPAYLAGVLTYRGEVLEAVGLRTLLGLEEHRGANRVLVLEGLEENERFGLVVDSVGGMVNVPEGALDPNPATLAARGEAMFSGVYRMDGELMIRLDPCRLRPAELAKDPAFNVHAPAEHKEAR